MELTLERFLPEFASGRSTRADRFLGAHRSGSDVVFRVWAPNAVRVAVAGDFNGWSPDSDPMTPCVGGIWELVRSGLPASFAYKYAILTQDGQTLWKADPYGTFT